MRIIKGKILILMIFIKIYEFRKEIQLLKFQTDAETLIFPVSQSFSKVKSSVKKQIVRWNVQ